MSDDITEAVRRLKELREDVERLKAAEEEEGQERILRVINETITVDDTVTTTVVSGGATFNQDNFNQSSFALSPIPALKPSATTATFNQDNFNDSEFSS